MFRNSDSVSQVIDNLRRVFQAINENSKYSEKMTGLTGPQLWVLKLLTAAAPQKVSELARHMYLHPATVVGILDRLETKGLVKRTRSKIDRRVVEIDLTEMGMEIVAQAPEVAQSLLVKELEMLPDELFSCVSEAMEHLVRILGAEHITPQPLQ